MSEHVRRDRFTVREVAEANGVSINMIYNLIYTEQVDAVRIGTRTIRIARAELERLGWAIPEYEPHD